VTRTLRLLGGEAGDCMLTEGGECRGVKGYAVDTGRGLGGGGFAFFSPWGVLSGTGSVQRGRSRDLRRFVDGVDIGGGGIVVKFSKRERSDDTGLMDDSSVAWSSMAMAAGFVMGQCRRELWLSQEAACGCVESARRRVVVR
jgi:hypothetical protein